MKLTLTIEISENDVRDLRKLGGNLRLTKFDTVLVDTFQRVVSKLEDARRAWTPPDAAECPEEFSPAILGADLKPEDLQRGFGGGRAK
jgi:hypothetical protein